MNQDSSFVLIYVSMFDQADFWPEYTTLEAIQLTIHIITKHGGTHKAMVKRI